MSSPHDSPESSAPHHAVTRLLRRAADQRARGVGWPAIAEKLGRSVEAWTLWLRRYPTTWEQLLRDAEGRVFREAGAEALQFLRGLLRSKNESICRDVGRTLATLMYRLPIDRGSDLPAADDGLPPIVQYLEALSDEDLDALESRPALPAKTAEPAGADSEADSDGSA